MEFNLLPCEIKRKIFDFNKKAEIFNNIKNYSLNLHKYKFNKRKLCGKDYYNEDNLLFLSQKELIEEEMMEFLQKVPKGIIGIPSKYFIDDNIEFY